jgi:hypothetical protein
MKNSKKEIVFFCATAPYVMIYKIAREFKKRNYKTILITICQKDKINDYSLYEKAFDKIICSNFQIFKPTPKNAINMLRRLPYLIKSIFQMMMIRPYVIFNISRPNYISAIFIRFFKKYPQIYFPADISSQLHETTQQALAMGKKLYEIKAERYCFEHADGILHKGAPNELNHLKRENMLGKPLKMTKNIICFNPYCSDEFIIPLNKSKLSKKDRHLHFVYTGSFYSAKEDIDFHINFFKKLLEQKIHLHLYAKTHHLSKLDDKKNLGPIMYYFKDSPYFHLHFAFPPKELIQEISKYDYGMWMDRVRNKEDSEHRFTSGNKFASYFEAGIPFVYTSSFKFIHKLMKRYGLDFPIDTNNMENLKNLAKRLKKRDYWALENKILKARKDFNMTHHFPRLESFIERVRRDKYYST